MPGEILTVDTPFSFLASQRKQHAASSRCFRTHTLHQSVLHPGSKYDEEDVHFLCLGTVTLTQFLSDCDIPILSLEQTYCVVDTKTPALLPSFTQDLVLNAVTDVALVSFCKQDFCFLLETSREFRAMVFAAAAEGIAQSTQDLDQLSRKESGQFEACASNAFWQSQDRPSELHKMSVQWLLQQQKGKPQ